MTNEKERIEFEKHYPANKEHVYFDGVTYIASVQNQFCMDVASALNNRWVAWQACAAKKDAEMAEQDARYAGMEEALAQVSAENKELQRKLAAYEEDISKMTEQLAAQESAMHTISKLKNGLDKITEIGRAAAEEIRRCCEISTTEHLDALLKAEREKCAKVCDEIRNSYAEQVESPEREFALLAAATNDCKAAIRALD